MILRLLTKKSKETGRRHVKRGIKLSKINYYTPKFFSRLAFKNSFIIHKPIDPSNGRKYITCSDFISIKPPLISMQCFIRYNVTARDLMNIGYQHSK